MTLANIKSISADVIKSSVIDLYRITLRLYDHIIDGDDPFEDLEELKHEISKIPVDVEEPEWPG